MKSGSSQTPQTEPSLALCAEAGMPWSSTTCRSSARLRVPFRALWALALGRWPSGFRPFFMVVVGKHFTFLLIVVWWELPT